MSKDEYLKKAIRVDMANLIGYVLDINGYEKRSTKVTGNKPTAFIYFSGHINEVCAEYYPHGWGNEKDKKSFGINLDKPYTPPSEYMLYKPITCEYITLRDAVKIFKRFSEEGGNDQLRL